MDILNQNELKTLFETSLYFLALLNPASKVLFLSARKPALTDKELSRIAWRATFFAFSILLVFCICGNFLMAHVFRVELYALKLAGGLVLLLTGLNAVQKGIFFHQDDGKMISDDELSVVPLASPLIAGPGTIAATVSYSLEYGVGRTLLSLAIALLINTACMLSAKVIAKVLDAMLMIGPLIRLTGLIIMAVAMQMMLTGAAEWLQAIP